MIKANDKFQIEFGERIRIRREEIGMTQEELAEHLGYKHKTSVSKIEKGLASVPSSKVVIIANALKVSVRYLMGDSSNEYDKKNYDEFRGILSQLTPDNFEMLKDQAQVLLKHQTFQGSK
ncbi:MAG: helix-turn-helix transcriptional regulator [Lachnospiraceae bacterium]|nr:helix-turn-helix transcriptional regulator [Lachnospiraceae bacterium]